MYSNVSATSLEANELLQRSLVTGEEGDGMYVNEVLKIEQYGTEEAYEERKGLRFMYQSVW